MSSSAADAIAGHDAGTRDRVLDVIDMHTYLGDSHIIQGVSMSVPRGKVVALLGRNGAGKTTTLRSIMRLVKPRAGEVFFEGQSIARLPTYEIARRGIALVHETRAIFPSLSVEENLAIALRPSKAANAWTIERVYQDFPVLAARRKNGGMQLSGGEQQMLAIARALVANPAILLLDEPSEGLAPLIVRQIGELLMNLKAAGMTMLLVEQNFALATAVADEVVVLGKGRVRWQGLTADFRAADDIRHTWLGV
jgi:branched-chain amino acid transport system ATP-binding protein